jgi:hypothetical protein
LAGADAQSVRAVHYLLRVLAGSLAFHGQILGAIGADPAAKHADELL